MISGFERYIFAGSMEKVSINNVIVSENTAERCVEQRFSDNGIALFMCATGDDAGENVDITVPAGLVQFYFALEGGIDFAFGPMYSKSLNEGNYYFMYNPAKDLRFQLMAPGKGRWVAMYTTIDKLHGLFLNEEEAPLPFLTGDQLEQPLYDEKELSADTKWALESLFTSDLSGQPLRIFSRGKVLEIIAHHFAQRNEDVEACPFLRDGEVRSQIKKAKQVLIERMAAPPSIPELAREIGISEYKLKSGFKEIYGATVGGYLLDYKMNAAKMMLDKGSMQVSEVAYALGYGSPSHLITAFKKKFGITPKKYVQQL